MSKQPKQTNIALLAAAVLLCLTLFTTHLTSGLYARYSTSSQGSDRARVATYVFDVSDLGAESFTIDLSAQITKPGDSATYTFVVTNSKDGKTSEVAQNYTLQLETTNNLPLGFRVDSSDGGTATIAGKAGTLGAGTAETHTYTLTVSWDAKNNAVKYAGLAEMLRLTVISQQAY